jgi:hypothetical protein
MVYMVAIGGHVGTRRRHVDDPGTVTQPVQALLDDEQHGLDVDREQPVEVLFGHFVHPP